MDTPPDGMGRAVAKDRLFRKAPHEKVCPILGTLLMVYKGFSAILQTNAPRTVLAVRNLTDGCTLPYPFF